MPDAWEATYDLDPTDPDDADSDADNDGLTNKEEYDNNTDPQNADSDGDGVPDGTEVEKDTDPTDSDSQPTMGMNPTIFYVIVGGSIGAIAILAVALYFFMVKNE